MSVVMDKRRFAERDPDLSGARVLVVGLGKSGLAAARLVAAGGARVTVTDSRSEAALGDRLREARGLGATIHAGGNPPELAAEADLIVVSPGVPLGIELLRRAADAGLPIWGEAEIAARHCRGTAIGVTGSNGKSTVTTMIGTILERAGVDGRVGGNLDTPFSELLSPEDREAVYVLELSSFQLETLHSLRPAVALILNLSPDHLDHHPSYEDYARAKARIFELQGDRGDAILNADDEACRRFVGSARGRLHRFSTLREVERGAFVREDRLVLRAGDGDEELLDRSELAAPGDHNVANALAAALAARLVGCDVEAIADGLRAYRPLPHRLEYVATVRGVAFYDDSKATNPASTARALTAFEPGRIHLILGGRDKGADWSELVRLVGERAKRVLLVGEASSALAGRLAGVAASVECGTVERAVAVGLAGAGDGDVVLLSPGCASFDQYADFEERGVDFKKSVRALEGSDA